MAGQRPSWGSPYDEMTARSRAAESAAAARQPRRLWRFTIDGAPHTLQLKKKMFRWDPGPRLFLDGRNAGNIKAPGGKSPRTEMPVPVGPSSVVVALEWAKECDENMRVDLFVDGVSQLDGRALTEARATAPGPVTRYDTQMWKLHKALVPTFGGMVITAFTMAVLNIGRAGPVIGLVAGAWMVGWFASILLVNRSLLARPGMGALRWLLFFAVAIGYGVVSVLLLVLMASLR